jgi:hypothetical protein
MRAFGLVVLTSLVLAGATSQVGAQNWAASGTATVTATNHPAGTGASFNAIWGEDDEYGDYIIINGVVLSWKTGCSVMFMNYGDVQVSCPPYWVHFRLTA